MKIRVKGYELDEFYFCFKGDGGGLQIYIGF